MIFQVSADEGMGKETKLVEFWTRKLFQIRACVISARKAKHLDSTTMFTYSHANTPLSQWECVYDLSYFINTIVSFFCVKFIVLLCKGCRSLLCSLWCNSRLAVHLGSVPGTPISVNPRLKFCSVFVFYIPIHCLGQHYVTITVSRS